MRKLILLTFAILIFSLSCSLLEPPEEFQAKLSQGILKAADPISPVIRIVLPHSGEKVKSSFDVVGTAQDNRDLVRVEVRVKVNGGVWKDWFVVTNTSGTNKVVWKCQVYSVPDGTVEVQAKAVDRAGNESIHSVVVSVFDFVFVSAETGDDSREVSTPQQPFKTLQRAVLYAVSNKIGRIKIAEGVYKSTGGVFFLNLSSGIDISGGWNSDFTECNPDVYETVLDGNTNTYHIIYAYSPPKPIVISGVKIIGGRAYGSYEHQNGAGIYIGDMSFSVVISNVVITNCEVQNGKGPAKICEALVSGERHDVEKGVEIQGEHGEFSEWSHSEIQGLLCEVGELSGYVAQKEFESDSYKFDCVWKKTRWGSPSHVFEVQVKGNVYSALVKLKYAFDTWNCKIIIVVASESGKRMVERNLKGHLGIKDKVIILTEKDISNLSRLRDKLKEVLDLKEQIGLFDRIELFTFR